MRTFFLGTSLFLCTVCLAKDTCETGMRNSFDVFVPNVPPGIELSGNFLFLKPGADNLGWAVQTYFLPIVTPNWSVKALHPSYQPAFNVGASYVFANTGINTQGSWTHLSSSDSRSITVTPVQQWISPFSQTGPGTANTTYDPTGVGQLTVAHGKVDFDYDAANLDVSTSVNIGSHMQIHLFSGLSGIRIKQKLLSTFQHPSSLPKISLENTSTYLGMGPRLGFGNTYTLYKDFRFVGELAAGLLFGSMQPAQYKFTGSSSALNDIGIHANREEISSKNVMQVVPSLETKLGLNYAYHFNNCYVLTIEGGYTGAIYINVLSSYETNENILPLELGSLSTGSMKHVQSNFSVNGPYATLSLKF